MKHHTAIGCLSVALALAPLTSASDSDAAGEVRLLPIEPVKQFILSPDRGSLLCWWGGQARVLDSQTHAVRIHVELLSDEWRAATYRGARFSQDGERAVLWTLSGDLTLLQLEPPRVMWREEPSSSTSSVGFRFDAELRRAAKYTEGSVQVLNLLAAGPVDAVPPIKVVDNTPPAFLAMSLSEDGDRLLVETKRGLECIELGESDGATATRPVDLHRADSLQFLGGGSESAIVLLQEEAALVDLQSGEIRARQSLPRGRWSSNKEAVAVSVYPIWERQAGLRVLDVETLDVLWEAETCKMASYDAASNVVVVIHSSAGAVTVHDARSGDPLWELAPGVLDPWPGGFYSRAIVFDGRGRFLASSHDSSAVFSFECRTGKREALPTISHGTATRAGRLTDEALWVADSSGEIRSLRSRDGTELASVALGESLASVEVIGTTVVASTVSGRTRVLSGPGLDEVVEFNGAPEIALALGANRILGCGGERDGWAAWSASTGEVVEAAGEAMGTLLQVACDDLGKVVVALDEERAPYLWVGGVNKPLEHSFSRVESVVVDPRGRWVVLGGARMVNEFTQPVLAVYDPRDPGPPRMLEVQGDFLFGGSLRSIVVNRSAEFIVVSTGSWGTVQCWKTSDWSHVWMYGFGSGSPSPLRLRVDDENARVWVWGLNWSAPRALDLRTGTSTLDFGETLLTEFSPLGKQRGLAAILHGSLVRLDHGGLEQWRRIDLGPPGSVTSFASGAVRGDPAALERVFVQVGERVIRASLYGG